MNYVAVILGSIMILATIVCVFLYNTSQSTAKVLVGIILVVILVIIFLTVCKNPDSWRMHGIFLKYSTQMIK